MSKLIVCSVFDSKVQCYAQPFFMRTLGEALRGWIEVSNDPQTQISRHPLDFSLMHIANYDESSGQFENLAAPSNLGTAASVKNPPSSGTPLLDRIRPELAQGGA